jgi:hypothetical protein
MIENKRTAREIKIDASKLSNKNINIKIGTVENRESPETIYIFASFWLEPTKEYENKDQKTLKEILERELHKIYSNSLSTELKGNTYFPLESENIFIKNIPENLNYNRKRNYVSIELYLHTLNIKSEEKLPLSQKKNTELFDECMRLSDIISKSDVLSNSKVFTIYSKSI